VLSIDNTDIIDPNLVHVEYGLAKDFGAAGFHIGCLVTKNADLSRAFQAIGLLHAPGGPSCHLASQILEDTSFVESLLGLSRKGLSENYALVTSMLDAAGIPYWRGGNAGYFLWIDLSRYLPPEEEGRERGREERERVLSERILEGGVWLNPGQERGELPGWFRLIYSHPRGKIEEGVRRIVRTLCGGETKDVTIRVKEAV
jgi:aspartate/methionine/tyrosine aminotransferase